LEEHDDAELMFYLCRQFADTDEPVNLYEARHEEDEEDEDPPTLGEPEASTGASRRGQRDQTQAMAFDYLGQSLVLRQDYDRAVWCWHETLNLNPAHPEANRNLAVLHRQRGQLERARLYFQRQLRLTPGDVETLLDFADLLVHQNRLAEAGDKYRRALECDATLAAAHERLGHLALINGHLNAASDRFERARQLDPALAGVYLGLAQTAHQRGEPERARQWLLEELDLEGQTAEQSLEIASLLVELELYHEAVRLLNPLLSGADDLILNDDPLYATALLCRGVARIAEGEIEPGMADCQRCLNLTPDNTDAILQLAGAYFQVGNLEEADQWVNNGLFRDPSDRHLLKLRQKLRRARWADRARRLLRR
ncbi:MAG: tetratricopeptide repeat protein, partial [Planctomycetota bacterium]